MEDVADAALYPDSVGSLLASSTPQANGLAAAPLLHTGGVIDTLAGATVSTVASFPSAPKVTAPVCRTNGVPAVPPVTSAPGVVIW